MLTGVHDTDLVTCRSGYETVLERHRRAAVRRRRNSASPWPRAFFGDPVLVVLDEPNSNLDAAGEQALTDTLRRAKERRVTVVVVTQRPTPLTSVDKVLVLKAGRAAALGTPDQVLRREGTARHPPSRTAIRPRRRGKLGAAAARPEKRLGARAREVTDAAGQSRHRPMAWRRAAKAALADGNGHGRRSWSGGLGFGLWASTAPSTAPSSHPAPSWRRDRTSSCSTWKAASSARCLVRDGQMVDAGQPLLRLDGRVARTRIAPPRPAQVRAEIMQARLEAEMLSRDTFSLPKTLQGAQPDPEIGRCSSARRSELQVRQARQADEEQVLRKEIAGIEGGSSGTRREATTMQQRLASSSGRLKDKRVLLDGSSRERPTCRPSSAQRPDCRARAGRSVRTSRRLQGAHRACRADRSHSCVLRRPRKWPRSCARQRAKLDRDVHEQIRAARDVMGVSEVRAPVRGIVVRLNHHAPGADRVASGLLPMLEAAATVNDEADHRGTRQRATISCSPGRPKRD